MRHHAAECGAQRGCRASSGEHSDFFVQQAGKIGMGRQIVEQDVPQHVCKVILQPLSLASTAAREASAINTGKYRRKFLRTAFSDLKASTRRAFWTELPIGVLEAARSVLCCAR